MADEDRNDRDEGGPMIRGGCLCGEVRFEVERFTGPFELCHCSRCRKTSGSAFASMVGVNADEFRLLSGADKIRTYEAPLLRHPPLYCVAFCSQCGSPVPNPPAEGGFFEIPAGILDDDPGIRPDKHIFVECKSEWFSITDSLPQFTLRELIELRRT